MRLQGGNYPLMLLKVQNDIFKMADMLLNTINNAWAAVPLCWHMHLTEGSQKDCRSVRENQELIKWHGEREYSLRK